MKLFDTIFIMTGGGPGTKTYTASFYLYTRRLHAVPPLGRRPPEPGSSSFLTLIVITFLVRRLLKPEPT